MRYDPSAPGGRLDTILEPWIRERRLVGRMLSYWHELRGEQDMPRLRDVNPERVGDDWRWSYIIETCEAGDCPQFKYLGAGLSKYAGIFLSGRTNWTMTLLDCATAKLNEVLQTKAPVLIEDEVKRFDGGRLMFRAVLLPMSDDGQEIDHVIGAANGKLID